MSKNLMPEIAKLLGVEVGEEFSVIYNGDNIKRHAIFEDGLCYLNKDGSKKPFFDDSLLGKILRGAAEVKKLPWEPKYGEIYYFPSVSDKCVVSNYWEGGTLELALKAFDCMYSTKAEAEAHLAEDYEKLTGKKLE